MNFPPKNEEEGFNWAAAAAQKIATRGGLDAEEVLAIGYLVGLAAKALPSVALGTRGDIGRQLVVAIHSLADEPELPPSGRSSPLERMAAAAVADLTPSERKVFDKRQAELAAPDDLCLLCSHRRSEHRGPFSSCRTAAGRCACDGFQAEAPRLHNGDSPPDSGGA